MPVQENLWPNLANVNWRSEPATILSEQGNALCETTDGDLYGEVEESLLPAEDGITYEFFVRVANKPYHYLLLSVHHGFQANYPVRISNTLAGTLTQVHDSEAFKRQLRQIFHAPPTVELLERMRSLAAQS